MTVELKIALPDDVYRAVVALADRRGIRVSDVITDLIRRDVRPLVERMTTAARDRTIRVLHGKGWSDRRIAERVGVSHVAVGRTRERLGLPRNFAPLGKDST